MNVFNKLTTLFRAGVRESAEQLTDANAIRIYRQEIFDAEAVLAQRRDGMAGMIATRKELEQEIDALQARISGRESQFSQLPESQRSEQLLQLAARDIAATEAHLEEAKGRHVNVCEQVHREELILRKLLAEVKQHRREILLLESQVARYQGSARSKAGHTVAGRLAALQETRESISQAVGGNDQLEEGMEEAIERVSGSALDRQLKQQGCDGETQHVEQVLGRLKAMAMPTAAAAV